MASPLLDEKILAIERACDRERIPHAFGGALALAYYATPRGTIDIDLNVFLPVAQAERVLRALAGVGVAVGGPADRTRLRDEGQVRLYWERTPIDLFFAYDPLHRSCLARLRVVPFGADARIPILSAEDLTIFKVLFDRAKDWVDLRELLFAQAGGLDLEYTLEWLGRILEPGDARLERFRELLAHGEDEAGD
jgi:hypothetical protein